MRVIHTIRSLAQETGGPAVSVPQLHLALLEAGIESEIIAFDDQLPMVPIPPWTTFVRSTGLMAQSRFRSVLEERCCRGEPPVIHDHLAWRASSRAAGQVARRLGFPLVVSPRGLFRRWSMKHKAAKKLVGWILFARRDARSARVLHAASLEEMEDMRRLGLTQPIAVVPDPVGIPGGGLRRRAGTSRVALSLGRIQRVKGLTGLIEAWNISRPADWRLVIAGPSEDGHREELERLVQKYGLENTVTFSGPAYGDAKSRLFEGADLLVFPSHSESFGVVVAEALGRGLPVIATHGSPWQVLTERQCGWWIPEGARALAKAIEEATGLSDDVRDEMGRRGVHVTQELFSPRSVARKMVRVYSYASRREGPPPDFVHMAAAT